MQTFNGKGNVPQLLVLCKFLSLWFKSLCKTFILVLQFSQVNLMLSNLVLELSHLVLVKRDIRGILVVVRLELTLLFLSRFLQLHRCVQWLMTRAHRVQRTTCRTRPAGSWLAEMQVRGWLGRGWSLARIKATQPSKCRLVYNHAISVLKSVLLYGCGKAHQCDNAEHFHFLFFQITVFWWSRFYRSVNK
jgi:hypothetical protein